MRPNWWKEHGPLPFESPNLSVPYSREGFHTWVVVSILDFHLSSTSQKKPLPGIQIMHVVLDSSLSKQSQGTQSYVCVQEIMMRMQSCLDIEEDVNQCARLCLPSTAFQLIYGLYVTAARHWVKVYSPGEIKFINFDSMRYVSPIRQVIASQLIGMYNEHGAAALHGFYYKIAADSD